MGGRFVGMKRAAWAVVLGGALVTAGCGGGGSGTSVTSTTVSGTVADGYLQGAIVFLDKNGNKELDAGEPSTTTNANGIYQLSGVTAGEVAAYPVVVYVPPTAVDMDNPGVPVGTEYVLSAPPGKPEFISPVTTLVHNQLESNPALDVAAAESAVKAQLGVTSAGVSLFDDFVAKKTEPGANSDDYDKIHKVAQVVATVIGNNMDAIQTAAPEVKLEDVIKVVVNEVVKQLTTIAAQVPPAGTALDDTTKGTLVGTVTAPSTVEEINQAVVEVSVKPTVSTFQAILQGDGFYWIEGDSMYSSMLYEYANIKLGSNNNTLVETAYEYLNGNWTLSPDDYQEYYLTANGWVLAGDGAASGTVTLNTDNTVTWTHTLTGNRMTVSVTSVNVAGKPVAPFVKPSGIQVTGDPVFPAGSEAYKFTMTPLQNEYKLWVGETGTNQISYPDQQGVMKTVASSTELLTAFADGQPYRLWLSPQLTAQFGGEAGAPFGAVKLFLSNSQTYQPGQQMTYQQLELAGIWEKKTVMDQEILIVRLPFAYLTQYTDGDEPGRDIIYAVHDGVLKQGRVTYANVPKVESDYNFNKTAFDTILANFVPGSSSAPGSSMLSRVKR